MTKAKTGLIEILIYIALWVLYRVGIVLNKPFLHFHWHELVSTVNYALVTALIIYYLLPRLVEKGRFFMFLFSALGVLLLYVCFDELLIDRLPYLGDQSEVNIIAKFSQLLSISVFFVVLKLLWSFKSRHEQLLSMEKQQVQNQLDYLRSQIHPHFLFNSLNNIYSLSLEQDKHTPEKILQLSGLLRYMLYETERSKVMLDKELEQLKRYIALQSDQLPKGRTVGFTINGQTRGYSIAPLLLFPFIENCFKHGLDSKEPDVSISLTMYDGKLCLYTANGYNKLANNSLKQVASGIGLDNVKKRLDILYPDCHSLHLDKDETTYRITLKIDLLCEKSAVSL